MSVSLFPALLLWHSVRLCIVVISPTAKFSPSITAPSLSVPRFSSLPPEVSYLRKKIRIIPLEKFSWNNIEMIYLLLLFSIKALLLKLEGMLHNSYSVNLLLTGVIIRLAAYPQPIIRSFLLHPSLVFQPHVKSLIQVRIGSKHLLARNPSTAGVRRYGSGHEGSLAFMTDRRTHLPIKPVWPKSVS